jgi:putative signal transducing protein
MVELGRYHNSFEAGLARSVLAEHGIDSILFDFNTAMEGASFLIPIRLMVDEDDIDEARRVLEAGAES